VIIFKNAPGGGGDTAPDSDTVILDDFSSARTNGAVWGTAGTAKIWYANLGMSSDPTATGGTLTATTGTADGGASKHQMYFRANDDSGGAGWRFIRTAVESGTFVNNTMNRMRFHVKLPSGYPNDPTGGNAYIHIGTYLHHEGLDGDGMAGSDDDNMHFYHFYNIPGDGLWWQVIVDTCPDHQREASGSAEHGNWEFPESSSYTYFANMTAFYWDYLDARSPGDVTLFKKFTYFNESLDEGTMRQVRSLCGAFDPASNTVKLTWNRRRDQPNHSYAIRWAHAPFASFSGGTSVGSINAPNTADFNTVYTTFSDAALASHQWVWVAIQPSGAASFRQIAIDLELND
jgi:hypothetical protein